MERTDVRCYFFNGLLWSTLTQGVARLGARFALGWNGVPLQGKGMDSPPKTIAVWHRRTEPSDGRRWGLGRWAPAGDGWRGGQAMGGRIVGVAIG